MRLGLQLCPGVALAFLTGCVTSEPAASWPRTGDALADGRMAVERAPARDRVLWECRTATVALRRGEYTETKRLLDDVLLSLGAVLAKDKGARQARSLFHEESRKTFRGEPYERVMAYYYRGILYWMDGELDNARACFRSAQLEDSDTENKDYANDYVLLDYLEGLATAKLGGDGMDAFNRAQREARYSRPPPYDPAANVLVFAEFGRGPSKFATGEYGEQLRFRPGGAAHRAARLRVEDQAVTLEAVDDLTFQATTRGGRVMDHILGNKAVFKSTTDAVGNAALIGGLVLAGRKDTRDAGLGLAAAGLVSKLISAATTPSADIRAWDNLPQFLGFTALRLAPGQHPATIEFLGGGPSQTPGFTRNLLINVADTTRDTVVFISDQNQ